MPKGFEPSFLSHMRKARGRHRAHARKSNENGILFMLRRGMNGIACEKCPFFEGQIGESLYLLPRSPLPHRIT